MFIEILFIAAIGVVAFGAAFFMLWGFFNICDALWTRWYMWRESRRA
jgi:hypothetical protein